MLTKEDLEQIRGILMESENRLEQRLEERLSSRLESQLDARFAASKQHLEERLDARFAASEQHLEERLDARFAASEHRLMGYFAEFVEQNINPQFEELRREIQFIRSHMITRFDLEDRLADFRLSLKGTV